MRQRAPSNNASFIDLSFLMTMTFMLLFFLAIVNLAINKQDADVKKPKAEFLAVLTWQEGVDLDVDFWVRDPADNNVWFSRKDSGVTHLDRDDLGTRNDTVINEYNETVVIPINQEIVTLRGFMPGRWVFNVHLYRVGDEGVPAHCNMVLTKLNPVAQVVFNRKLTLDKVWDEKTMAVVEMDSSGKVLDVDLDFNVKLVESKLYN